MSADLFAAFSDTPSTSTPQQNQPNPSITPASTGAGDPFSFLGVSTSASRQQSGQSPIQWPQIQTVSNQTNSFPSPQINKPVQNNGWGDIRSIGGFQTHTMAKSAGPSPLQLNDDDEDDDDEDGWGDFEVANPVGSPQPTPVGATTGALRTRVVRASTMELFSNKLVDLGLETSNPSAQTSWGTAKREQPQKPSHNPDPDVLFDADYEADNIPGEDDDFGDFEAVAPVVPQATPKKAADDLLSLIDVGQPTASAPSKKQPLGLTLSNAALSSGPSPYPQAPKSPYGSSFQDRKPEPVKQLQVKPPTGTRNLKDANQASASPVTAWPTFDEGFCTKWEEFKDIESPVTKPAAKKPLSSKAKAKPKPKPKPAPNSTPAAVGEWGWQDWGDSTTPAQSDTQVTSQTQPSAPSTTTEVRGPPPTNIPPPSVLLSLFPQLLDVTTISFLKPLLTLSATSSAYQRVISSPQTLTFLKGYLALATVAARVIAGRKHRWHRDKFLSQSMSISATSAGGKSGMKLTGVDKTQSAREDREAAEVVEVWKKHVGRLRTVVGAVNTAHTCTGENLRVPDLALSMTVTTTKYVPTAPNSCVVCGLKRDERVSKVDAEVEDSFGEWWIEFWGHRACSNFWVEHEKELRQR